MTIVTYRMSTVGAQHCMRTSAACGTGTSWVPAVETVVAIVAAPRVCTVCYVSMSKWAVPEQYSPGIVLPASAVPRTAQLGALKMVRGRLRCGWRGWASLSIYLPTYLPIYPPI